MRKFKRSSDEGSMELKRQFSRWLYQYKHSMSDEYYPQISLQEDDGENLLFSLDPLKDLYNDTYDFGISYSGPRLRFFADWNGNCSTEEMCYWIELVKKKNPTTVPEIMNAVVDAFNKIDGLRRRFVKEEEERYYDDSEELQDYDDEELQDYDEDDYDVDEQKSAPEDDDDRLEYEEMMSSRVGMKSISNHLLKALKDYGKTHDVQVFKNKLIIIVKKGNHSCAVKYDFSKGNNECPIVTMVYPRFPMVPEVPIKASGLIILDGLTPHTWRTDVKDIIKPVLDLIEKLPEPTHKEYDRSLLESEARILGPAVRGRAVSVVYDAEDTTSNNIVLGSDLLSMLTDETGLSAVEVVTSLGVKMTCGISNKTLDEPGKVGLNYNISNLLSLDPAGKHVVTIRVVKLPIIAKCVMSDVDEDFGVLPQNGEAILNAFSEYKVMNVGEIVKVGEHKVLISDLESTRGQSIQSGFTVNPDPNVDTPIDMVINPAWEKPKVTRDLEEEYGPLTIDPYSHETGSSASESVPKSYSF